MATDNLKLGAVPRPDGATTFLVWAPKSHRVELHLVRPVDRVLAMDRLDNGYFSATVDAAPAGTRYFFRHNGAHDWPDPASRSQPDGVHGASEVVDPSAIDWSSGPWRSPAVEDYVIYEVHIGTFTEDGTFDAAVTELDRLRELGVTAVELMPIAEFPGRRNWGYDGAYPFAADSSYGGPSGLARLVDACHRRGIAVVLDVVYNHFGPEGAYLGAYGHYFTDHYRTPWGSAINFDGPYSDDVRRYFIESALFWLRDLHIDAFRLDAVHAIHDQSAYPFLRQFADEIHRAAREIGRVAYVIAESDLNDPRVVQTAELGGFGFDAQWSDDFHHALHARLTGEWTGYYVDFGSTAEIRRALQHGYVFTGQHSRYRRRRHGALPSSIPPSRFVVCGQNHDQVGNRATAERMSALLSFEQVKLAAATVLLSPFVPLMFMGEEYGEQAPFLYFTDHGDQDLIERVRNGRAQVINASWPCEVSDCQDHMAFERSRLRRDQRCSARGRTLERFYRELTRLRRELRALQNPDFDRQSVDLAGEDDSVIVIRRWNDEQSALIVLNFHDAEQSIRVPGAGTNWRMALDSTSTAWGGPLPERAPAVTYHSGAEILVSGNAAMVLTSTTQDGRP